MQGKGHHNQPSVANFVNDDTANDDPKAETGKTSSTNRPKLESRESVFTAPVVKNSTTDGKTNPRGKDRHETSPKQALCVGSNLRISCATHQPTPSELHRERNDKKERLRRKKHHQSI